MCVRVYQGVHVRLSCNEPVFSVREGGPGHSGIMGTSSLIIFRERRQGENSVFIS